MSRNRLVVGLLSLILLAGAPRTGGAQKPGSVPESGDAAARLDQAAADLLAGHLDTARAAVAALAAPSRGLVEGSGRGERRDQEAAERQDLRWSLAHAILSGEPADAFGLLSAIVEKSDSWVYDDRSPMSATWDRLLARYAAREGYPAIRDYAIERARRDLGYLAEDHDRSRKERAAAQQERTALDLEIAAAKAADLTADPARSPEPDDPVAPTIRRLLEAPRIIPFEERPLPAEFRSTPETTHGSRPKTGDDENTDEDEAAEPEDAVAAFPGVSFPANFEPVRVDRHGDEAAAIGLSQDYDPVGEVSRGAYWILRSHDGGKTWGEPLYTGLRMEDPYVVHATSKLPMLTGDRLEIEVSIRELDPQSITFPPVMLRARRRQDGLMLRLPFAALERDLDADGLTDLAEERLVTDPGNPDTDGDGLGDRDDPFPQVPWSGTPDPAGAALQTVLQQTAGMKSMAIIHEIGPSAGPHADVLLRMRRATLTDQESTFIEADRRAFRALLTTRRGIVLSPDETALARKKFGILYPLKLTLFVLDHSQERGYVIWSASWVGGAMALDRRDGVWTLRVTSSWIT